MRALLAFLLLVFTSPAWAIPLPKFVVADFAPYADATAADADAPNVDWDADPARGDAVALGWAALELSRALTQAGKPTTVTSITPSEPAFFLRILPTPDVQLGDQGYRVTIDVDGVRIEGNTRAGMLNGTYRVLYRLGFRYWSIGDTSLPSNKELARIDWPSFVEKPATALRGFWIPLAYGASVPEDYAVWMARNRLNLSGTMPRHLREKLGIVSWQGGHRPLQEELSTPGLFEAHPEWYGLVSGTRRPIAADTGTFHNPAFVNAEMAAYVADRLIARLDHGDLADTDLLAIWPSDGNNRGWDESDEARAVGNNTDTLLLFYQRLRDHFRAARLDGRLRRDVQLSGIVYNDTWEPPTNPALLQALAGPDFHLVFYAPFRSFSGSLSNTTGRDTDTAYLARLDEWKALASVNFGLVEYFNNSRYGAVPITDYASLREDFARQLGTRAGLIAYMHPLYETPGPRNLTNALLARLAWDGSKATKPENYEQWIRDYFNRRFGAVADQVRAVYALSDLATSNAREVYLRRSLHHLLFIQHRADNLWSPSEVSGLADRYLDGGAQIIPAPDAVAADELVAADFVGVRTSLAMLSECRATALDLLTLKGLGTAVRGRLDETYRWCSAAWRRYELMRVSTLYYREVNGLIPVTPTVLEARAQKIRDLNSLLIASPFTADTVTTQVDQRDQLHPPERLLVE